MITIDEIKWAMKRYFPSFGIVAHDLRLGPRPNPFGGDVDVFTGTHPKTGATFAVHAREATYALAKLLVERSQIAGTREPIHLGEGI